MPENPPMLPLQNRPVISWVVRVSFLLDIALLTYSNLAYGANRLARKVYASEKLGASEVRVFLDITSTGIRGNFFGWKLVHFTFYHLSRRTLGRFLWNRN